MYVSTFEMEFLCIIFFSFDFITKWPNFLESKSGPKKEYKKNAKGSLEYIIFVVKLFFPKDGSTKIILDLDIGQNFNQLLVRGLKKKIFFC